MKEQRNWVLGITIAALVVLAGGVAMATADNEARTSEMTEEADTGDGVTEPALDGAKVYAWNCGSCHSERWPKERNDADWKMIMTHMRVRANLTADQTAAVLSYLQENN